MRSTALAAAFLYTLPTAQAAPGITVTTSTTLTGTHTGGNGAGGVDTLPDGTAGTVGDPGALLNAGTITVTNQGTLQGGNGGNGGGSTLTTGNGNGNGGNGAMGGAGAQLNVSGTAATNGNHVVFTNDANHTVTGGTGGRGGDRGPDSGTLGQSGAGGAGVLIESDYAQIVNNANGALTGGTGGAGANSQYEAVGGTGGVGGAGINVFSRHVVINNMGTIIGGVGGTQGSGTTFGGFPSSHGAGIYVQGNTGSFPGGGQVSQLTNSGLIEGQTAQGVYVEGEITTFDNNGSIIATGGEGVNINYSGSITTLNNADTIATDGGTALFIQGSITTINNTGTIQSYTNGKAVVINAGLVDTFHNNGGTITTYSGGAALQVDGGEGAVLNLLTNNGGTITTPFGNYAIYNQGGTINTLNNDHGSITSAANTTATIYNFGTFYGANLIGTITNDGGTIENTAGTTIQNEATINTLNNDGGTIQATNGIALYNHDGSEANGHIVSLTNNGGLIDVLSANVDALVNDANSVIDTLDNTGGTIRSLTEAAINNAGLITTLTNGAGGLITIAQINGSGVNNTGTITTLNNAGQISAGGDLGNAVYNNGALTTLTNTNIISTTDGRAINNDTSGAINSLTNVGGTISSQYLNSGVAYAVLNGGTITSLDNTGGTISTQSGTALVNNGTITTLTNGMGGLITADVNGYGIGNRATGIITAFNNAGTISALDATAFNNQGILNLNNSGTISATSGVAIDQNGGTFSLVNTGTITSSSGGVALQLAAPVSGAIDNTGGTISVQSTFMSGGGAAIQTTQDVGNLTITGGTIVATGPGNGLRNFGTQTGLITLDNLNISAASGNAAIFNNMGALNVAIGSSTTVTNNVIDVNGTLSVENSGTINGLIADVGGTLSFTNSNGGTVNGNVSFDGDDTLTLNGGAINGTISLDGGTNALIVNSAFTTGGAITSTNGGGSLTVNNGGSFTADDAVDLGAGTLTTANGGTLTLGAADVTTTGAFTNGGTTAINVGRTLSVGSLNTATAGTLSYTTDAVGGNLTTGVLNTGGTAANLSNQTVNVDYIGNGNLNTNTRSLIATGTGAATLPNAAVTDNSFLYDFEAVRDATLTNQIYLQLAAALTPQQAGSNYNNQQAGAVLLGNGIDSNDPQIAQIKTNLANAPDSESYNRIVESTEPTADNGNATAATNFTSSMFDLADGQLAMVNTGDVTGVASGEQAKGLHPWAQAFGGHADQDERSSVAGYQANTYGVAAGVDTRNFGRDTILGVSVGYGRTRVNSDNANSTTNDVDTYQVMAYGNHDLGNDVFVTGMGAFGWNENDQTRHSVGGISGLDADADYHAWQLGARASVGKNYYAQGRYSGLTLTPSLVGDYVHYDQDSYTESGAGGANLRVNGQTQNMLNLGGELRAAWLLQGADGMAYKPDLHVGYKYNLLNDDKIDATNSFAAGGSTFNTNGLNPSNSTYNVGTGLRLYSTGNWDFTANYDYTFKTDYSAHSGFVRAAYEF